MANTKEYSIVINGVKESVNAVDELLKKLNELDARINELNNKASVNVSVQTNVGDNTNVKESLNEQDALQKQILATEEKLAQVRDENYQKLLHLKEELKEYTQVAKSAAAATENQQGLFDTKTMAGMKAQLKSIKTEMQTLDVSSDRFRELTMQANEINTKLKEIEQSYGQFGRNVGNYANGVAEGMQKVVIKVGDTERTFESAKQAARELGNELKNMAVNGQQGTEEYKNLDEAVKKLNSTLKDVSVSSQAMDNLLDTVQSITALASTAKGLGALFGFDNSQIEESIQKLVALQNVLQGIETIRKQMQTQEGIGLLLSKGSAQVDKLAKAIVGVGTASKAATVATKALSVALKGLGIGLAIAAISAIIKLYEKLTEKSKKVAEQAKKTAEVQEEGAKAYAKAKIEIEGYLTRINKFNGSKQQEKKIVDELNSKYGTAMGNYQTIAKWKDTLIKKGEAYCQVLIKEAEAQAILSKYTEAYLELQKVMNSNASDYEHWYNPFSWGNGAQEKKVAVSEAQKTADTWLQAYKDKMKEASQVKLDNKLFDYSTQVKSGGKKTTKATTDVEKEITKARIDAMKEGLNKTITQLEEERKERLAKISKNSKDYAEYERLVNQIYDTKIEEEKKKHSEKVIKLYKDMWDAINDMQLENTNKGVKLVIESNENAIDDLKKEYQKLFAQGITNYGGDSSTKNARKKMDSETQKNFEEQDKLMKLSRQALTEYNYYETAVLTGNVRIEESFRKLYTSLAELDSLEKLNEEMKSQKGEEAYQIEKKRLEEKKKKLIENHNLTVKLIEVEIEEQKKRYELFTKRYNEQAEKTKPYESQFDYNEIGDPATIFDQRMSVIEEFFARVAVATDEFNDVLKKKEDERLKTQLEADKRAADERLQEQIKAQDIWVQNAKDEVKALKLSKEEEENELNAIDTQYQKAAEALWKQHNLEIKQLEDQAYEERLANEKSYNEKKAQLHKELFSTELQEFRDFQSELSNLESKAVVTDSSGLINVKETKKNLQELASGYQKLQEYVENALGYVPRRFMDGMLDKDTYDSLMRELGRMNTAVADKLEELGKKSGDIGKKNLEKIVQFAAQYAQVLGQSLQQVLQAVWDNEDAAYDKLMDDLEKQIDEYEKLMDRQQEIAESHKAAIDDIEDELSGARGDRRQQLIDNLNAEMAAQRAALAQEKKAEKEKERLEKKKEEEEAKQRKKEHQRAVTQAIISAALATVNGLATQPFMPVGIAMGALAAALGAVQVALIKSQKYASGGVIEGKSHSQGGVKVLGGRAEVEGGEYITNKVTTQKNVDLLYYINSKKRRIDLDDMIEFYSGKKVRKNISSVSSTRFADGGQIPTLNTNISTNNLTAAFAEYANRPSVVSVVEIMDKTQRVNQVRTLAGYAD